MLLLLFYFMLAHLVRDDDSCKTKVCGVCGTSEGVYSMIFGSVYKCVP